MKGCGNDLNRTPGYSVGVPRHHLLLSTYPIPAMKLHLITAHAAPTAVIRADKLSQ